jgi:bisphosphoglycerate-dependent phosphoglycerate mutase
MKVPIHSHSDIVDLEIPYSIPLVYEFNKQMQKQAHYYIA